MKRALIIYAILFAVTIAVPALVCFGKLSDNNSNGELVNIFRQCITLFEYYH